MVIYDYNSPTPLQAENLPGHMPFDMNGGVRIVIVDDAVVYEDGQYFEVSEIYAEARKAARRLWQGMDSLN